MLKPSCRSSDVLTPPNPFAALQSSTATVGPSRRRLEMLPPPRASARTPPFPSDQGSNHPPRLSLPRPFGSRLSHRKAPRSEQRPPWTHQQPPRPQLDEILSSPLRSATRRLPPPPAPSALAIPTPAVATGALATETVEGIVLERRVATAAPLLLAEPRRTSTSRRSARARTTIDEPRTTIAVGILEAVATIGGTRTAPVPRSVTIEETTGRGLRGARLAAPPRTTTGAASTRADENRSQTVARRRAAVPPRRLSPRAPMVGKGTGRRTSGHVATHLQLVAATQTRSDVR